MLMTAWLASLMAVLFTVPFAILRYVAIGEGGFERSRTMVISARFAAIVATVCVVVFLILSLVVLSR